MLNPAEEMCIALVSVCLDNQTPKSIQSIVVPLNCIGLLSYSAYKVLRGNQLASKDGRNRENKVSPPIRITTTSETTYVDGLLLQKKVKEEVSTVQAGLKEP